MTTRYGSTPQGVSPKHQAFVDEYMKDRNATQAAIRAGYSRRKAKQIGSGLLTKVDVAEDVGRRIEEHTRIAGIETLKILEFLRDALFADPLRGDEPLRVARGCQDAGDRLQGIGPRNRPSR
jgi:phage terminase small subunit